MSVKALSGYWLGDEPTDRKASSYFSILLGGNMRHGYIGYWKALEEYKRKFPQKEIKNYNRQLVTNRLGPGTHYNCKVHLKEKGKRNKIVVGFENRDGTFVEHMWPDVAELFIPGHRWTLHLEYIGDTYINKIDNVWKVIRNGTDVYVGVSYQECKEYIISNNLQFRKVVINHAERED
jgi:hypothetical protein